MNRLEARPPPLSLKTGASVRLPLKITADANTPGLTTVTVPSLQMRLPAPGLDAAEPEGTRFRTKSALALPTPEMNGTERPLTEEEEPDASVAERRSLLFKTRSLIQTAQERSRHGETPGANLKSPRPASKAANLKPPPRQSLPTLCKCGLSRTLGTPGGETMVSSAWRPSMAKVLAE